MCYDICMNVSPPYKYTPGYIMLPLEQDIQGLNDQITLFGDTYTLKKEFHVTLIYAGYLCSQYSSINEEKILRVFNKFVVHNGVEEVTYFPEYRLVTHPDGRKSIIQKVEIENFNELYEILSDKLGMVIPKPVTHITIYVNTGQGIAVETEDKFKKSFELRV